MIWWFARFSDVSDWGPWSGRWGKQCAEISALCWDQHCARKAFSATWFRSIVTIDVCRFTRAWLWFLCMPMCCLVHGGLSLFTCFGTRAPMKRARILDRERFGEGSATKYLDYDPHEIFASNYRFWYANPYETTTDPGSGTILQGFSHRIARL